MGEYTPEPLRAIVMSLNDRETEIDLMPDQWVSSDERSKPHEPFWGPGLIDWIAYVVGFAVVSAVVRYFVVR